MPINLQDLPRPTQNSFSHQVCTFKISQLCNKSKARKRKKGSCVQMNMECVHMCVHMCVCVCVLCVCGSGEGNWAQKWGMTQSHWRFNSEINVGMKIDKISLGFTPLDLCNGKECAAVCFKRFVQLYLIKYLGYSTNYSVLKIKPQETDMNRYLHTSCLCQVPGSPDGECKNRKDCPHRVMLAGPYPILTLNPTAVSILPKVMGNQLVWETN